VLLSLKLNAKHLAEVLTQAVAGGTLDTTAVLRDERLAAHTHHTHIRQLGEGGVLGMESLLTRALLGCMLPQNPVE